MGQIIIDLPSRIKRRYRLDNEELTKTILASLETGALPVKTNARKLTAEDKEDIRAARRARKEEGFVTLEQLKAELGL